MDVQPTDGTTPRYGTWIRSRALAVFALLTAAGLALSLFALVTPWALLLLVPAAAFGWITLVLALARHRFSDTGGQYQGRIHELIRTRARGIRVLDIGCGSGRLSIELARETPLRRVTGLDYWGSAWEYSQRACEQNARIAGVARQVNFIAGSAASLPFLDAEFDCVVSCLTFHEVRELKHKTEALAEALRVLRPGGSFVLLDLFSDPSAFPQQQRINGRLEEAGAIRVADTPLSLLIPLPFPLNGKRLLKHARLVSGEKAVT